MVYQLGGHELAGSLAGSLAGIGPRKSPIQQAAEGGGVGEAVHEEVEGGESDQGPTQRRDAGDDKDGAGKGDDAEEAVGAQERGWVFGKSIGMEWRDEVTMKSAREAPAGADRAGREHQNDERDEPGGCQSPSDHE